MKVTKHGTGPWLEYSVSGVTLKLSGRKSQPMELDCAAMQREEPQIISIGCVDGKLVIGGKPEVAKLSLPKEKFSPIDLADAEPTGPHAADAGDGWLFDEESARQIIRFSEADMEAVELDLFTLPAD